MFDLNIRLSLVGAHIKISAHSKSLLETLSLKLTGIPSAEISSDVSVNASSTVCIDNNQVIVDTIQGRKKFRGNISKSDLYVLLNMLCYNLFLEKDYIPMHSVTIRNQQYTYVIFGGFGQGKTTLANTFRRKGFVICGADQSVFSVEKKQIIFTAGSHLNKFDGKEELLNFRECNTKSSVDRIFVIQGMSDEGLIQSACIRDKNLISKRLSNFFFWPYFTPVISLECFNFMQCYPLLKHELYKRFLESIPELTTYRGDKVGICETIIQRPICV